jgi:hypothetical protein
MMDGGWDGLVLVRHVSWVRVGCFVPLHDCCRGYTCAVIEVPSWTHKVSILDDSWWSSSSILVGGATVTP